MVDTGVKRELVTPTGAAILTTLATSAGTMPAMTVEAVGYGAGDMDLEAPNVLRFFVGRPADSGGRETIMQVETTVDDMQPQLWEAVMERLFEAGALDVYLTPVMMKKSRPGTVLTALCTPDKVTELSHVLFEESPTIGVRWTAYRTSWPARWRRSPPPTAPSPTRSPASRAGWSRRHLNSTRCARSRGRRGCRCAKCLERADAAARRHLTPEPRPRDVAALREPPWPESPPCGP